MVPWLTTDIPADKGQGKHEHGITRTSEVWEKSSREHGGRSRTSKDKTHSIQ